MLIIMLNSVRKIRKKLLRGINKIGKVHLIKTIKQQIHHKSKSQPELMKNDKSKLSMLTTSIVRKRVDKYESQLAEKQKRTQDLIIKMKRERILRANKVGGLFMKNI